MKTNSTIKSLVSAALLALPFALLGGCSSGGGGAAPTTTPTTTSPGYTVSAVGANGGLNGGFGGTGGVVDIDKFQGVNNVSVSKTGTANASFTTTAYTANLGTNPLNVTANTTIQAAVNPLNATINVATSCDAGEALPAGSYYVSTTAGQTGHLFISTGTATVNGLCDDGVVAANTYYVTDYGNGATARSLYLGSGNAATADTIPTSTLYMYGTGVALSAYTSDGDNTVADAILPAGTAYLQRGSVYLYISDNDNTVADLLATGISVASGVTLTIDPALGVGTTSAGSQIILQNDITNAGTITTADATTAYRGSLELNPSVYVGSSGSSLTTAGAGTVVNGGNLSLFPNEFLNSGSLDASGVASSTANGGAGGSIYVYASFLVENTGSITSNGGASTFATGFGGNAGYIALWNNWGHVYNSGAINSNGGAGVSGGGNGVGADLGEWFYSQDNSSVINSGNITAVGGSASAGPGGDGGGYISGEIGMYSAGAPLINSGTLTATGGATTGTGSASGIGGVIYLDSQGGNSPAPSQAFIPAGPASVSGNLDASGGAAVATTSGTGSGGSGGYIFVGGADDQSNVGSPLVALGTDGAVQLLGYKSVSVNGGNGSNGGNGGYMEAYAYANAYVNTVAGGGSVNNEADISANGGSTTGSVVASGNLGGVGGTVFVSTDQQYGLGKAFPNGEMATNSGAISASAGNSLGLSALGTPGGSVMIYGNNGLTNTGAVTANGSTDTAAGATNVGYGGFGGHVLLANEFGTLSNSGALTANGGNGAYVGGSAVTGPSSVAVQMLSGGTIVGTGAITANGGNADATLTGSTGGNGGKVKVNSFTTPSKQTGVVSVAGGTGATPGLVGLYVKQ